MVVESIVERVAPRAGAWIETGTCNAALASMKVAPRAGAWIETLREEPSRSDCSVAPESPFGTVILSTRSYFSVSLIAQDPAPALSLGENRQRPGVAEAPGFLPWPRAIKTISRSKSSFAGTAVHASTGWRRDFPAPPEPSSGSWSSSDVSEPLQRQVSGLSRCAGGEAVLRRGEGHAAPWLMVQRAGARAGGYTLQFLSMHRTCPKSGLHFPV